MSRRGKAISVRATMALAATLGLASACVASLDGLSGAVAPPDASTSGEAGSPALNPGGGDASVDSSSELGCELPPAAALMLWLRADDIDASAGAPVALWPDHSGNGRHFTQTSPGAMPSFAPQARNGQPTVGFGAQAYLALDHEASAAFHFVPGADFATAIVAFAATGIPDYQDVFGNEDPTADPRQGFSFIYAVDAGNPLFAVHGSCCPSASFAGDITGGWHQLLGVRSGGSVSIYVDGERGTDQPSGGSDALTNASDLWLGKSPVAGYLPFQGSVAEVLVWSGAPSDAERACLFQTLRLKYGLP